MLKIKFAFSEEQKNKIRKNITQVPKNEEEVKRIFYKLEDVLGFENVHVFNQFPDASAFYDGREIDIEFEKNSIHFKQHKHNEKLCDLIICWEHNDPSLKIPVLELSTLADNWLQAREEAITEYNRYWILGSNKKDQERIKYLLDTHDFTHQEALAHYMQIAVESLKKTYSSALGEKPECFGGSLQCEKRDLNPIHLEINVKRQLFVPVVFCRECENKEKCSIGRQAKIGYFFNLNTDEKRPRKIDIKSIPIENEKIIPYLQIPKINIWKSLRFNRR